MGNRLGPRNRNTSSGAVTLNRRGPTIVVQDGSSLPPAQLSADGQTLSGFGLKGNSVVRVLRRRPPATSFIFLGSVNTLLDGTWEYAFADGAILDSDQVVYEGAQTSEPITIALGVLELLGTPPSGTVGVPYSFTPSVRGGRAPYTFGLPGTPPAGLTSFSTTSGKLSGTPTGAGNFAGITMRVTDADGLVDELVFAITIAVPSSAVPANVSPPTISLTRSPPREGDTATGGFGAWSNSPSDFAGQWYTVAGGVETAIPGATTQNHLITSSEVGKALKFGAIATNGTGPSTEVRSSATAAIVASGVAAPLVIGGEVPNAYVGEAFSFTPTVTGGDGSTKVFALAGSVPAWTGFAFNTATGKITGTPPALGDVAGLSITVKDASDPTGKTFSLGTITVGAARAFQNRVRQHPADANFSQTTVLNTNFFQAAAGSVTLAGTSSPARAPADPSIPANPKAYTAGWIGGVRETPVATAVLSRASGARLSFHLNGGLLPELAFKDTGGVDRIKIRGYPYSYSPINGVRVRRWGALSLGGDPDQFCGVFFDTTTVAEVRNAQGAITTPGVAARGKLYRRNNLNNGGQIENVTDTVNPAPPAAPVFVLTPNATYDTSFFGDRQVFGSTDNAFRDAEHAVFWEHYGVGIDWAAQAAVADDPAGGAGAVGKYAGKTYLDILRSPALRGDDGEGILKAAGVWATVEERDTDGVVRNGSGVPVKWSKPHTFLNGADGVAAWTAAGGYNRGTGPKLVYKSQAHVAGEASYIGTNVETVRYARLSDVTSGANYQPRDSVDQARFDAAKGKVRDSLRVDGGAGSDYAALPTDPAAKATARVTRIKEQVFSQFLKNHGFDSLPGMELREETWGRIDPKDLVRPSYISATSWQAGLDAHGFINARANGYPEPYNSQKYGMHDNNRDWSTIGHDGTRTPTGNREKQYFAEFGDTTRTISGVEQVVPYDSSWQVFNHGRSSDDIPYFELMTKPLGDTSINFLGDDTRFVAAGMVTSWPGKLQLQYGVTWIQFKRYRPAIFPLRTAAGDFFSAWLLAEDGKIATNWHGVYREKDGGENVARTAGTCPLTYHTSLCGTGGADPASPYYKERMADHFFDQYIDDAFLELAIVLEPPGISGVGYPVPAVYMRRAFETQFRLVTGNSKVVASSLIAGLPGAANPYKPDTPFVRNGLNGYTHGQNPRATAVAQAQLSHWRLNNAWDPDGFFNNWDDGSGKYPMVTTIGAIGYAIPDAWANGAQASTRTFDYRNSRKQHKRGVEIALKPTAVTHGSAYAPNTAHTGTIVYTTAGGAATTLERPILDVTKIMSDASGTIVLPGNEDGWGWQGGPEDIGKKFSLTVTRTNTGSTPTVVTGVVGEKWAGDGLNPPVVPAESWPIIGTNGDDILLGSAYPCHIIGAEGNDIIYPGATTGATLAVDAGSNGDLRRKQQNRIWPGTDQNVVYCTAGAFDWIKPGRKSRTETRTKIVIPTGHTGVTRLCGFKPTTYAADGTAQVGDILDLTGYGFADLAAVKDAMTEDTDLNTVENLILQLPGVSGKVMFEPSDFIQTKKADLRAENFILTGGGYVAPSVPLAAAGNYIAGFDCKVTTKNVAVAVSKASLVALSQPIDAALRTFGTVNNARNGTVALSGTNVIFTPATDFIGIGGFDFTVTQGAATYKGTMNVRVERVPVAGTIAAAVTSNTPKLIDLVSAAAEFGPSSVLYVSSVGTPAKGKLAMNGTVATYTPNTGASGADSFGFVISDGYHVVDGVVNVTIAAGSSSNVAPVAANGNLSTAQNTAKTINLQALASDANGDLVIIATVGTAVHGSVSLSAGVATYTPAGDYTGSDSFTYTASDGALTATGTITVTVAAAGGGAGNVRTTSTGDVRVTSTGDRRVSS